MLCGYICDICEMVFITVFFEMLSVWELVQMEGRG